MKPCKLILLTYLAISWLSFLQGQNTTALEIRGRVVEKINGKTVGIPKIKVKVSDTHSDITASDGSFRIIVPSDRKSIKISIVDEHNREMLNPPEGIVPLPPSGNLDIYVCAKQNQALRAKVAALNNQIKSFQTKFPIAERQIVTLQKQMLDTIMYFEGQLQLMQEIFDKTKSENETAIREKDKRLQESEARIQALEQELKKTVDELLKAKDEYFLKKNEHLQRITSELRGYLDALQNLRNMITLERIPQYFTYNPAMATQKLNGKIDEYNAARDLILKNQDADLMATRHYWQDPSVAQELQDTYSFLLSKVHDNIVLPMDTTVIGIMKAYQSQKLGRQQAENKAKKIVNVAYPKITAILASLEEKINSTISNLKQNF